MHRLPVYFIGHGSPMNIIAENDWTHAMARLRTKLPAGIESVLVISAHWLTDGTYVTCSETPRQIYDFFGFPDELYTVQYRPPGNPNLAQRIRDAFPSDSVLCDNRLKAPTEAEGDGKSRGLDHGSWAVLHHLFPEANVPVVQLSLNARLTFREHYKLGLELRALRNEGVLIIGSGNIVHNLRAIDFMNENAPAYDWAEHFDATIATAIESNRELVTQPEAIESFQLAHPSYEHYLPLLYVVGAADGDSAHTIFEGIQNASISMRSVGFG
ncbi:MAG: 4,5-DOPA dioxygenase extradiol [Leptospiraceae bacterium]|nr:4,5-DOPA dioxygenase extradiol [Leptospiraceae bacterium]